MPARVKLTKRVVDALPLPSPVTSRTGAVYTPDVWAWDSVVPGFGVRVRPNGRRCFAFQYRDAAGKSQRVELGEHGIVTAEEARAAAMRLRVTAVDARRDAATADPAAQRARARTARRAAHDAPTVADVADAFLADRAAKLKPSTVAEYRRLLGVVPVKRGRAPGAERVGELRATLGRHKVADVTRAHVAALHLGMQARPYMANRALAALSALFTFAERQGHRPDGSNPCRHVAAYPERKRERYLSDAEFVAIGAALRTAERAGLAPPPTTRTAKRRKATPATAKHRPKDTAPDGARAPVPWSPVVVAALRFLILTGWREGEARTLRWADVDVARGVATLGDTKTGRSVRELSAAALAIVDAMRRHRHVGNPHVFPGTKPGAPLADLGRPWDAVRHAAGLPDVRLHDLRHAFASVGASQGFTLPVIGHLLGHTDSATTARYAHLTDHARARAAEQVGGSIAAALAGDGADAHSGLSATNGRPARLAIARTRRRA